MNKENQPNSEKKGLKRLIKFAREFFRQFGAAAIFTWNLEDLSEEPDTNE